MPETELEIWQEYHAEQPFGEWREDLRMGIVASAVANTVSSKGLSPADFMPFEKRAEEDFSDFLDGAISV